MVNLAPSTEPGVGLWPSAPPSRPTTSVPPNRAYRYSALVLQLRPSANSTPVPTAQPTVVLETETLSGLGVKGGSEKVCLNSEWLAAIPTVR